MQTSITWKRPDLQFPPSFDTVFFDVDGVLIKTTDSFRATDIAVAEYVASNIHGLDWGQQEGKELVTLADVNAFKQAGGYNNDWDMCYLLASLSTARLREWKGTVLAERSSQEWAAHARAAHLQGHGGRKWVDEVIPASACLDYGVIGDLYHEYYWGAEELQKRFGHSPRYLFDAAGFVFNEEMLFTPGLPARLREAGIQHLGMITGRVGPEVDSALERMETYSGERWWDVVISADVYSKPDPRALQAAIAAVNTQGGMYIGDTADDYDVVINYRNVKQANDPEILTVMLVGEEEVEVYQKRGADFIIGSVEEMVECLPEYVKAD
ncbi:MAG: TIGR01548 family HAD-type hydrolase [Ktedonobacteraceae bacterium]